MEFLKLSRKINDGLHLGHFTQEEIDIVNAGDFQRLRGIMQTGLAHLVWPSATHTRFAHCLGTCCKSQMMLNALFSRSKDDEDKLFPLADARPGQAVRIHELEAGTARNLQRTTRLAALLHDFGHGPLSHTFDPFAPTIEAMSRVLDDPRLNILAPLRQYILSSDHGGRVSHEGMTCVFLAANWHEQGKKDAWIVAAVAAALLNAPVPDSVPADLHPWISLVRGIIVSGPINADRLDYLERDSKVMNVPYGMFSVDRVLESILCIRTEDERGAPTYQIGWRMSGLGALEGAIHARRQMYHEVYYHKTKRAVDLMVYEAARLAAEKNISLIETSGLAELRSSYRWLSDTQFMQTLAGTEDTLISSLARRIMDRDQLWKFVYSFEEDQVRFANEVTGHLNTKFSPIKFMVDQQPIDALKDLDDGAMLVTHTNAEGRYRLEKGAKSWVDHSELIKMYRDSDAKLVRIFKMTDPESVVSCSKSEVREAILLKLQALT